MPLPIIPNDALGTIIRTPRTAATLVSSPFDGSQEVQSWGGEWWEYSIEFYSQTGAAGRQLAAFFTALGGPTGTFILKDPAEFNSASVGTPLVDGTLQTGKTLNTKGWTPSTTVLTTGQFIQLGTDDTTRLHMVTEDAVSDGSGLAALAIWPKLRVSPDDDDPIVTDEPGIMLRLQSDVPHNILPHVSYQFSALAREAL